MIKAIKNYEVIENNKDMVITYSLLNFNGFKNGEEISLSILEINGSKNLKFSSLNISCEFKDFPFNKIKSLSEKRIIIAGFSENNEITTANVVSKINIVKKPKLK